MSPHFCVCPFPSLIRTIFVVAFVAALALANPTGPKMMAQQQREQQPQNHSRADQSVKNNFVENERERLNAYIKSRKFIDAHNLAYEKGNVSFSVAPNHLITFTPAQYKRICGLRQHMGGSNQRRNPITLTNNGSSLPKEVDWRKNRAVAEIKDQGECGSCWAFSATGAIEGAMARKNRGGLVSLSEQNLMDCSGKYGNKGCDGGLMDNAFEYVKDNHGVDTEKSYPYKGQTGKCHFKKEAVAATVRGFRDLEEGDEEQLKLAVAKIGPISVGIDASNWSFRFYNSGVYFERQCSDEYLDHGVLVVGYGTDERHGDFWLVKNSWGTDWGENGYVRIARNRDNHCGIATMASYPLV